MQKLIEKIKKRISDVKSGDQAAIKSVFLIMVVIIILSFVWAIASETMFKSEYKRPQMVSSESPTAPLSNSLSGVISSTGDLMEIMKIKSSIDSLVQKEELSESDSVKLLNAFKYLEFLNHRQNP